MQRWGCMVQDPLRWLLRATLLVSATACGFAGRPVDLSDPPGSPDARVGPTGDADIDARLHAAVAPVALGTAGTYAILAKSGISGIIGTVVGDLGVSPAAATYITGFSLAADATNTYATSAQVTGRIYAASYVAPTPAHLTLAVADMELAFTDAAARAPEVRELAGGLIGGLALPPGSYAWTSAVAIVGDVTLSGGPDEVWLFQVAGALSLAAQSHIVLAGGALAKNVVWQVTGGPVTLAAGAQLAGIVLAKTSVTLAAGASVHGRLLAQTNVDVDGSSVTAP